MQHAHTYILLLITTLLLCGTPAQGQTVEQVKARGSQYYWGEGTGKNTAQADKAALAMLIGSISVNVDSKFSLLKEEIAYKDKSEIKEQLQSVVNTYSNATIKNTEILSWGDEPEVHVFRFIKKAEVNKIFAEREQKIKEFVHTAMGADTRLQVDDALRYYYWALMLLQSHPEAASIGMEIEGRHSILAVYIPERIKALLEQVKVEVTAKETEDNVTLYTLGINYRGMPAANCEYAFFDGRNWSVVVGARDGVGVAEMLGDPALHKTLRVKIEYVFENEWRVDPEVYDVLQKVEPIVFKSSYIDVPLVVVPRPSNPQRLGNAILPGQPTLPASARVGVVHDTGGHYTGLLQRVEQAIGSRNYQGVQDCFTPEGYEVFMNLVAYGNGVIVAKPKEYAFLQFEDGMLARSLPMRFSFGNNRRAFVEDVVFTIDPQQNKISSLSFGLSKPVIQEIMQHDKWSEYSRVAIVNFIENYQTAYALKRLDYIESIFSDNALIIVGKVMKKHQASDSRFVPGSHIKRTQYTKAQYMKQLSAVFRSNEYVNLRFTEIGVKKAGTRGEIYGIQLAQDYFSTSYGDSGYLFLLVDLNDPEKPLIHIRTWQPEKDPDFGVYDLAHF